MAISYNKLWKLLIDKGLKKNRACEAVGHHIQCYGKDGP